MRTTRRSSNRFPGSLVLPLALALLAPGVLAADPAPAGPPPDGGRILVRVRADAKRPLDSIGLAEAGVEREREFRSLPGLATMRLLPGRSAEEALERLRALPDVLYAEPDARVRLLTTPDDPLFPSQWGLLNTGQQGGTPGADVGATEAWDVTTGSLEVAVGVVDSGVAYDHPDLAPNIFTNAAECDGDGTDDDGNGFADDCHGIDARAWRGDPSDGYGHGTHLAGIIGAVGNNATGIGGVAWRVTIVPCKFIGDDGAGWVSDALTCLDYLAALKDRGLNLVATNNSWGGGPYSQALADAIESHRERGILFIAAAGNDGHDTDQYPLFPAAYTHANVIAVAAVSDREALTSFSREGRRSVHLAAPGDRILSTWPPDQYVFLPGTSMAAPFVTGAAALLAADDPGRSAAGIRNLLLTEARRSPSLARTLAGGMLDIHGALSCTDESIEERVLPVESSLLVEPFAPVDLAVLHAECEWPAGAVDVTLVPGNEKIALLDDGAAPDEQAGDGVYSARWTPTIPGEYLLRFGDHDAVAVQVRDDVAPPLLGDVVSYPVPAALQVLATAVGELTGDGTPDVVALGYRIDPPAMLTVHVFPGTGGRALGAPVSYELLSGPGSSFGAGMAVGDLDGDGRDDVAVASAGGFGEAPFLGVLYQSPGGGLEPMVTVATVSSQRVRIADLDGDGRDDLVSAGLEGVTGGLEIRRQGDAGALGPAEPIAVTFGEEPDALELVVGDADGDGRSDLLVLGRDMGRLIAAPRVALLKQDGDGGFEPPRFLADRLMPTFINAAAIGDVNGDGQPEVVIAHGANRAYEWKPYLSVFGREAYDGGGSTDHVATFDAPSAVAIADVDGDGRNDAVVAHAGWESLSIHRQGPHGRLFPHVLKPFSADTFFPDALAVGDLDRDGAIDVVFGDVRGTIHVAWGEPVDPADMRSLAILLGGDGAGRVVSDPPGIDCGEVCQASFKAGTWVHLRGEASSGSTLEGWRSRDCTTERDGSCTVVVTFHSAVQADFERLDSRLTVQRWGSGSGHVVSDIPGIDCGDDCDEEYPQGWWVTLTATPDPGSEFAGWDTIWCQGSTEPTCRVKLDRDEAVNVSFKIPDATLTVRVTGGEHGEVWTNGTPCRGTCERRYVYGTTVDLFAWPDEGASFAGWTGACTGFGPCVLVMDGDREVGAGFSLPLAFDPAVLPDGEIGLAYRASLAAQGGRPPYTFALVGGKLPKGLSLSAEGTLAGTPRKASTESATIEVRDAAGGTARRAISISVVKAVKVATKKLPKGGVGRAYSATLSAKNGRPPMTWTIAGGSLPTGLALDPASGRISGTPETAGSFSVPVQVEDALGGRSTRSVKLKVTG